MPRPLQEGSSLFKLQTQNTVEKYSCSLFPPKQQRCDIMNCRNPTPKRVTFLGDSTMARLFHRALVNYIGTKTIKMGGRCHESQMYFYLKPSTTIPIIQKGAGPVRFGKSHRGCRDCSACDARLVQLSSGATFEFITVEFAKDFEIYGDDCTTTQECVVNKYLKRRVRYGDIVIFNTGLHDCFFSLNDYKRNLPWYTSMLKALNATVLWLSTTAVYEKTQLSKYKSITRNLKISQFNTVALDIMARLNIPSLDAYTLSLPVRDKSTDGVHMPPFFYSKIWALLSRCICNIPR